MKFNKNRNATKPQENIQTADAVTTNAYFHAVAVDDPAEQSLSVQ